MKSRSNVTTKLAAPDGACKQIDVGGVRYDTSKPFEVGSKSNERALRAAGCFVVGTRFDKAVGYRCTQCGFLALFPTCGRCGSDLTIRED